MKLEDQVCSLELAKRLKDLGVDQKGSLFLWWRKGIFYSPHVDKRSVAGEQGIAAFTAAELGEMLPWMIEIDDRSYFLETSKNGPHCKVAKTYGIGYCYADEDVVGDLSEDTEADARAKMLIYLLENKLTEHGAI